MVETMFQELHELTAAIRGNGAIQAIFLVVFIVYFIYIIIRREL